MSSPCSISTCVDILIDIFSRLPVKSLVCFTSVCRLWKSIITSPQLRLLSNRPTRLLVHTNRECYTVVEDEEEEEKKGGVVFEADFPSRHGSNEKAVILGSDNGLICILIHRSFIVWNPSIRKHVVFPEHLDGEFIVFSTGFGATNSGLDYKLVRIVGYTVTVENYSWTKQIAFHIYSLKAGTWRRFDLDYESYLNMDFISLSPAVLRGRLHWLVSKSSCFNKHISTLELEDEVFENKAMMLPEHLSTGLDCLNQHVITVIRESLAVIAFESSERSCTSLWVMQEYGDGGSWVKWCSIDDQTIENFNLNHIQMVGVLKNGNLLLTILYCPYKFVTWDPKTMKTNDFGGGTGVLLSPLGVCGSCYYKESLALLADEDRAVSDHRIFV